MGAWYRVAKMLRWLGLEVKAEADILDDGVLDGVRRFKGGDVWLSVRIREREILADPRPEAGR